jgi:maltokinase
VSTAERPVPDGLAEFLDRQRWFAGKGREYTVQQLTSLGRLHDDPPVDVLLLEVDEDGERVVYQLPVEHRYDVPSRLDHAVIGTDPDGIVCDALHDREVTGAWLAHLNADAQVGAMRFHRVGDDVAPLGRPSLVMTAEQSNTSVVFGDAMILKVYRRVVPGANPDVEVHTGLAAVGCRHIAQPLGWVDSPYGTLAFLQEFLASGTEGWELAKASIRDLFVEADLHADEVGGDFAREAERLGAVTAEVHAALRTAFPPTLLSAQEVRDRAARMHARLDSAVREVPRLAPYAPGLRATFDALAEAGPVPAQRVHGDFHLGQTMRTAAGWKVLDFEGEPATPATERRAPDTPLRDVAGMLRSFDYVARQVLLDHPDDPQRTYRAEEWAQRNRTAYCRGYARVSGHDLAESTVLLRALEAEKAVYEVVYEARMRPTWLPIPLAAVERLAG